MKKDYNTHVIEELSFRDITDVRGGEEMNNDPKGDDGTDPGPVPPPPPGG